MEEDEDEYEDSSPDKLGASDNIDGLGSSYPENDDMQGEDMYDDELDRDNYGDEDADQ
jgi:hypothetical protein